MDSTTLDQKITDWQKRAEPCIQQMNMELVTYGFSHFDRSLWTPIQNSYTKPKHGGGFWGCPVETDEWRDWCICEEFNTNSLHFNIIYNYVGNTFIIDSLGHMMLLPWVIDDTKQYRHAYIDFELMVAAGIDGVFLTSRGQCETRHTHPENLYGWDVESVLIMNQDSIITE